MLNYLYTNYFFKKKIYLFILKIEIARKKKKERGKALPSDDLLPKWPQ